MLTYRKVTPQISQTRFRPAFPRLSDPRNTNLPRFVLLCVCHVLPLVSESVGLFLANETKPEYLMVPYSRVVITPDVVPDTVTWIQTDLVSDYTKYTCRHNLDLMFPQGEPYRFESTVR